MVHGINRIPYRIDLRLSGLAGLDRTATISFGLPFEPEDSQYGKSWYYAPKYPTTSTSIHCVWHTGNRLRFRAFLSCAWITG